jgi:hypothetical protein
VVAVTAPFPSATLDATLERITYANEDTGYTVAKVDTGRGGELVTVVGSLLGAQPGEALRLRGRWGAHPQYGRQFHVEDYITVLPATVQGRPPLPRLRADQRDRPEAGGEDRRPFRGGRPRRHRDRTSAAGRGA